MAMGLRPMGTIGCWNKLGGLGGAGLGMREEMGKTYDDKKRFVNLSSHAPIDMIHPKYQIQQRQMIPGCGYVPTRPGAATATGG